MTKIAAIAGDITQKPCDALVVNLFEGVTKPGGGTGAVDRALDGAIASLIADGEIRGKQGETTLIHTLGKLPAKRVVVAGLGKQEKFSTDVVREVSGDVARHLARIGAAEVTRPWPRARSWVSPASSSTAPRTTTRPSVRWRRSWWWSGTSRRWLP